MLERKITKRIEEFYSNHPQKAMMIIGARQVGKSYIIEKYAKEHYQKVMIVPFMYVLSFSGKQKAAFPTPKSFG